MDSQTQTIDTVAAVTVGEMIYIFALGVQRITADLHAPLFVDPYIRRVRAGHAMRVVIQIAREDIQSQNDDTVASVGCAY